MACARKAMNSTVFSKLLNFEKGEQEEDVEKDIKDEENQDCEDGGEKDPKEKQASVKKTHSQLIFELMKKKASKSGTSSQKKKKSRGPMIVEIEDDDPIT